MSREENDQKTLTESELLNKDPRIAQAKQLLLEAVQARQSHLTGVKPPNSALKVQYDDILSQFTKNRGAKLWFPFLGSGFGKGALVELLDGSVKYDFITGIGPHFFGHSHPDVIAACIDAAISDTVVQGHLQQNGDSAELVETLVKVSGFDHCFLTTSGAMANENALKTALQKKTPASRILAFEKCFVGRSLALACITDKASFREGLPIVLEVDYLPFFDAARPEESIKQSVNALKKLLKRYPHEYAVMCFELVQGEGGFYPGSREFFIALMTLLKDHNIAIFDDEVQTFGRLPELFAYHYFDLKKYIDIVSIGKLSQVCATLFTKEFAPRPGLLSQTFTGSTSSIKTLQTELRLLLKNGFYGPEGKIQQIHLYFTQKLSTLAEKHPHLVKGPFGIGGMIAFTPFDGETQRVAKFTQALFDAGVMGFIAGSNPTRLRFLIPAGVITYEDIDKAVRIIEETLINFEKSK